MVFTLTCRVLWREGSGQEGVQEGVLSVFRWGFTWLCWTIPEESSGEHYVQDRFQGSILQYVSSVASCKSLKCAKGKHRGRVWEACEMPGVIIHLSRSSRSAVSMCCRGTSGVRVGKVVQSQCCDHRDVQEKASRRRFRCVLYMFRRRHQERIQVSVLLRAMASSRSSCSCWRSRLILSCSARSLSRLAHSSCSASLPN